MYEKIIDLIIRINADITLSDIAKDQIVELLETCTTEQELARMEHLIDNYATSTGGIIETALARKAPEELRDIHRVMSNMVTEARDTIETFVQGSDKSEAKNIILSF